MFNIDRHLRPRGRSGIWHDPGNAAPLPLLAALAWRIAAAVSFLSHSGLLAATLVRMAPSFGMDKRLLDAPERRPGSR